MKTKNFVLSTVLIGGFTLAAQAEKVDFNTLPTDLKQKIQAHSGANRIEDVDHEMRNGKMIYEVAFKQDGKHKELVFNEQGQLLNADGSVAVPWAAAGAQSSNTSTNSSSKPVPLNAGYKIQWEKLPEHVRSSFLKQAPGRRIEDIEAGTWNGQTIYQFAFKDQNNRHTELQLNQQGTLIHDPRINAAAGAQATSLLQQKAPLSAGYKIPWEKLPPNVRSTFLEAAPGRRIEDIEGGTWNGKTVYQFGFKDQSNQHVELQIDQQGNLIYDPTKKASNTK